MTPKQKFAEGEKVLCFHGPLIYEAKALKSTITKDKQIKYYIHYAGWNKNWDEWVPENRVLKYNEANVQRQKDVFKQHSSTAGKNKKGTPKAKKSEGNSSATKDSGASSGGSESRASTPSREISSALAAPAPTSGSRGNRSKQAITCTDILAKKEDSKTEDSAKEDKDDSSNKKKRTNISSTISSAMPSTAPNNNRFDSCVESEESFLSKIEVKIKMPDELKQCLADDWDAITRQHKLLDLPAKNTVQDIVDQYVAFKKLAKSTSASKELAITDVLNGVIEYFNVMLGSQLLYKFERPQYADILQQHPETPLSKLYGAFHLLRLFVKLGSMLGYSALDEKSMQMLLAHLHDFLKFLVKNSAIYFSMSNFVNVSPEYHRHTQ
ncbi:nuA4 complex subunit EAF3 homolog isoform X2 [Glossina fuscipes]|uniref:Mortality factor 4-like protein 1 n=1 Tax=Glossina fuscipes TaxID=7396 RepID=A0A9C6E1A2_9MUSC|nr:nuA4 complex subunit EAF3 homolog isoform X2 [Glossina fuscipes]